MFFGVLVVLSLIINSISGLSIVEKNQINTGLAAGEALANVLKDGEFSEGLKKLATRIAPFMSTFAPLAAFALSFIPSSETAVMRQMRLGFQKLNNRLDSFHKEFKDVKRLIDWTSVRVSYGVYEHKIRALQTHFMNVMRENGVYQRQDKAEYFMLNYEGDFDSSALKLYHGITESNIFSENIFTAALKYTENHRRQVQKFMTGIVQLLLTGIEIELAYYGFKEWDSESVRSQWKSRMNNVIRTMRAIDRTAVNRWEAQSESDLEDVVRENRDESNQKVNSKLYGELADKFYWLRWLTVVYDPISGGDNHMIWTCDGHIKFRLYEKNVVTASVPRSASTFSLSKAKKDADSLEDIIEKRCTPGGLIGSTFIGKIVKNKCLDKYKEDANKVIDAFLNTFADSCGHYRFVGVVERGNGMWYKSNNAHRYSFNLYGFHILLFG